MSANRPTPARAEAVSGAKRARLAASLPSRALGLASRILRASLFAGLSFAAIPADAAAPQEAMETYADIALAAYEDSRILAQSLNEAVDRLAAEPSERNLQAARQAWLRARVPYVQTETLRFGNPLVDDWEGKVNAWPLDEGLIDYVEGGLGENEENPHSTANVIANPELAFSGRRIDASRITPALLAELHEIEGLEANVARGYHAVEFLLWGQDLNGTGPGAGERPATDFDADRCTGGNCDRRVAYLRAAAELLLADLDDAVAMWSRGGAAREAVLGDPETGVTMAFTGMGAFSYGELAGERMKLGLLLHDPEEEHDCFSDNTHNSHYYGALGVRNFYAGRYVRIDGNTVSGPSLHDYVRSRSPDTAAELRAALDRTMTEAGALKAVAESGMAYDRMLAPGNAAGEAVIRRVIDSLVAQTRVIARAMDESGLQRQSFEGADSPGSADPVFE